MEIVPLDPIKLAALMLAGGVFALAGLWLMFRPQVEGHAAVIELFGLKVQASSAGLLVFLIGAGFLALPIVVPERQPPVQVPALGSAPVDQALVPIIVPEGGPEVEPNDHPRAANIISIGHVYWGSVEVEERDYFRVAVDSEKRRLRFIWRVLQSVAHTNLAHAIPSYRCRLDILDQNEVNVGSFDAPDRAGEAISQVIDLRGIEWLYFKIEGSQGDCRYELETHYVAA